jgi:hypothetical protein
LTCVALAGGSAVYDSSPLQRRLRHSTLLHNTPLCSNDTTQPRAKLLLSGSVVGFEDPRRLIA